MFYMNYLYYHLNKSANFKDCLYYINHEKETEIRLQYNIIKVPIYES